jgi:hypothetical protein
VVVDRDEDEVVAAHGLANRRHGAYVMRLR